MAGKRGRPKSLKAIAAETEVAQLLADVSAMAGMPLPPGTRGMVRYSSEWKATPMPASLQRGQLACSLADLARAAVSVGREHWIEVLRSGPQSRFEVVYRAAMMYANITTRDTYGKRVVRLARSSAYERLDPSEKGAVSYFVAMAMAKHAAERTLGIPWLLHLDAHKALLKPVLRPVAVGATAKAGAKQRPDLLGFQLRTGYAIAIEAKGRSNEIANGPLKNAKDQLKNLLRVNVLGATPSVSVRPRMKVAIATGFTRQGILYMRWEDPPGGGSVPDTDEPGRIALVDAYYRPLVAALMEDRVEETHEQITAHFPEVDLSLGLPRSIVESEGAARMTAAHRAAETVLSTASDAAVTSDGTLSLGLDGVMVRLGPSWFGPGPESRRQTLPAGPLPLLNRSDDVEERRRPDRE